MISIVTPFSNDHRLDLRARGLRYSRFVVGGSGRTRPLIFRYLIQGHTVAACEFHAIPRCIPSRRRLLALALG